MTTRFLAMEEIGEHRRSIQALAEKQSAYYMQTLEWFEAIGGYTWLRPFATITEQRLQAYSLVRAVYVPLLGNICRIERGPVAEPGSLVPHLEQLIQCLRSDAIWIEISPYYLGNEVETIHQLLLNGGWIIKPFDHWGYSSGLSIDVTKPIDQIRQGFRRSLKTQLNKAKRLDIVVDMITTREEAAWFFDSYNQMARQRQLSKIDGASRKAIETMISYEHSKWRLLTATREGEPVAGILLVPAGDRLNL